MQANVNQDSDLSDWTIQNKDIVSEGYNFRYANYFYLPDSNDPTGYSQWRNLFKIFGIRFVFLVSGEGKKFAFVTLVLNIGTGLALLSIATFLADFITLFILPRRNLYQKIKYEFVTTPPDQAKKKCRTR